MNYGPCVYCGAVNYPLSMGGPTICPSCDCGNFGPKVVRALGTELVAVRSERAALAAQLEAAKAPLPRGCICPPTSEQTCMAPLCPRRGVQP
jgi:hypothetical protein